MVKLKLPPDLGTTGRTLPAVQGDLPGESAEAHWELHTPAQRAQLRQELQADLHFAATLAGVPLQFSTTWGLFSPRRIDAGTELLLEHIEVGERDHCLDLGCGYGPIGMTLARLAPLGQTLLVDKDVVAVEYAQRNLAANGIGNARCQLSNGFRQIAEERFHVIATNLPAKVGRELLYLFLLDARRQLLPGGCLYVVTITGLRRFIARACQEVFGHYEKVRQGKDYTVARACLLEDNRSAPRTKSSSTSPSL